MGERAALAVVAMLEEELSVRKLGRPLRCPGGISRHAQQQSGVGPPPSALHTSFNYSVRFLLYDCVTIYPLLFAGLGLWAVHHAMAPDHQGTDSLWTLLLFSHKETEFRSSDLVEERTWIFAG